MKTIELVEALTVMSRMWHWLAENPTKWKDDFIKEHKDTDPLVEKLYESGYDCAACFYDDMFSEDCDQCPLFNVWVVCPTGGCDVCSNEPLSCNSGCAANGSPFRIWEETGTRTDLRREIRSRNALKIAQGADKLLEDFDYA